MFAAVTMTDFLLYECVPTSCEEWTSTAIQRHAIIATRYGLHSALLGDLFIVIF